MKNNYSSHKLSAHPSVLDDFRKGGQGRLLQVHLMWQNRCNQGCEFCSYRMPDNKNSEVFDDKTHLSLQAIACLLGDLEEMGVEAIELTGGGEPMLHPQFDAAWEMLASGPWEIGMVTNGTMLTEERAKKVVPRLQWLRISIDAADPQTYQTMRKASPAHYGAAWNAIYFARHHAPDRDDFRLGAGFVLSNENWREVYRFVNLAKKRGADNVRLSSTFSSKNLAYFEGEVDLEFAARESIRAKEELEDTGFSVHNFIPTRLWESEHPVQDYKECRTKDLLCVVEGEGKVFTCCTFAGSRKGEYGNFLTHPGGFRGLWEEKAEWRRKMDASKYCRVPCLYRDRNKAMNAMIASDDPVAPHPDIIHKFFV